MTDKCEWPSCCEFVPDAPRCAHCFQEGIPKNGVYNIEVYEEGRSFWLCENHYQIAWEKLKKW